MTEPVGGIAATAPPAFAERARRVVERALEVLLWRSSLGMLTAARAARLCAKTDYDGALPILAALVRDPDIAPHILALSQVFLALCQLSVTDAREAVASLSKVIPDDVPPAHRALAASVAAAASRQVGDYPAMLAAAERALGLGENADRLFVVALAKKNLGDLDGAIAALDRALVLAPKSALTHVVRAGYGVWRGEADARARADEALRGQKLGALTRPDALTWAMNRAWLAAVLGDVETVAVCLDEASGHARRRSDLRRLRNYIDVESDFKGCREHPAFAATVARIDAALTAPAASA